MRGLREGNPSCWIALGAVLLLAGCAGHRSSVGGAAPGGEAPRGVVDDARVSPIPFAAPPADDRSPLGARVAAHAEAMSAAGRLPAAARADCSGFVTAVYAAAGRPLEIPARYQTSGSVARMLHRWASGEGKAFRDRPPRPGDLAFFRDTTGPVANAVTHVALVARVGDDGTVLLVHYMHGQVRHDPMSVTRPGDPAVNAYFRKRGRAGDPVLAGQLFVAYARFDEGLPSSRGGPTPLLQTRR